MHRPTLKVTIGIPKPVRMLEICYLTYINVCLLFTMMLALKGVFGSPEGAQRCRAFALIRSTVSFISPTCFMTTWFTSANAHVLLKVFSNSTAASPRKAFKSAKNKVGLDNSTLKFIYACHSLHGIILLQV